MAQRCMLAAFVCFAGAWLAVAPAHAATFTVSVGDDYFQPTPVTIQQGDTVTWTWVAGADSHNVTSTTPSGVLRSGNRSSGSWSYTFASNPPGTYSYVCTEHSNMRGSVVVQGADTTPPPAPTASPRGGTFNRAQTVTLADAESTAAIHYTTDGTTPSATSTRYTGAISISSTTTLKAVARDAAGNQSPVTTETYTIDTAPPPAPTASPAPGAYTAAQSVTLTDAEPGVTIRYTTDGSTPTGASTAYTGPIRVDRTMTIRAIAFDAAGNQSSVAGFAYTIDATPPPAPTASPPGGTYNRSQSVALASEPGATIRYTTDGSTPTGASTAYTAPITVDRSMTIRAIAFDGAGNASGVSSFSYTVDTVAPAAPSASPAPGTYTTARDVVLSAESGAVIRYTTDGSTPSGASTAYTGPIRVAATTTIRAIALDAAGNQSPVGQFAYTIDNGLPSSPTASPSGGTYAAAQTVSLASAAGTTIRYTTDGSVPTSSSTQYTGPLRVDRSMTIRAIAIDGDGDASPAATFAYVIDTVAPPAPTASPAAGSYRTAQDVALAVTDPDAAIHYTTDGSAPTASSARYTTPIRVASTATIRAIAIDPAGNRSGVAAFAYVIDTLAPPAPAASPEPGRYGRAQQVALSVAEAGADILYTTDGGDPRASGTRYDGAITVDRSLTIRAVAADAAGNHSAVEAFTYVIDTSAPPAPTANPAPGTYATAQAVALGTEETGATIRYTTDGSEPTSASTPYAGPIEIEETTTIKTAAFDDVGNASAVAELRYVIDAVAPPRPAASPPGGRYEAAQDVTLSVADPEAAVHYTTDGSEPGPSSTRYTAPIDVDRDTTILAVAIDRAGNASATATFEYVISPPPPATARVVKVARYEYAPAEIVVNKGETVTWDWTGPDFNHSVTSDPGSAESFESHPGVPDPALGAPSGGKWERRFASVGTFDYFCRLHPEMRGSVKVVESGAPAEQPADNGTGTSTSEPPPATTAAPEEGGKTWSVDVANNAFSPAALTVAQGDSVTWRWTGADVDHSVTTHAGQPETFESHPGVPLSRIRTAPAGGTFSHTFSKLGTSTYFCRLHPDMKGRVTVVERGTAPAGSAGGAAATSSAEDPTPPRLSRVRLRLQGRRLVLTFRLSEKARLWGGVFARPEGSKRFDRVRKLALRGRRGANRFRVLLPARAARRAARLRVRLLGADASGNRARAATASAAVARRP